MRAELCKRRQRGGDMGQDVEQSGEAGEVEAVFSVIVAAKIQKIKCTGGKNQ